MERTKFSFQKWRSLRAGVPMQSKTWACATLHVQEPRLRQLIDAGYIRAVTVPAQARATFLAKRETFLWVRVDDVLALNSKGSSGTRLRSFDRADRLDPAKLAAWRALTEKLWDAAPVVVASEQPRLQAVAEESVDRLGSLIDEVRQLRGVVEKLAWMWDVSPRGASAAMGEVSKA